MRYKLLFLFLLVTSLCSSSFKGDMTAWERLLHVKNGKNLVANSHFFLSSYEDPSPTQELNAALSLFRGDNAQEAACAFPARYLFLKEYYSDLVAVDLEACDELHDYFTHFQKERVSIVFSSEYINSPSSAFGHILVIFRDHNSSYDLADTIHFAAETGREGFFTYSYKGFTGKYKGFYQRESFYKKIYEYNILQQRYMYLYTLDLAPKEIEFLIYHLYELRKAIFKYYFLDGNCASHMNDFLSIVTHHKSPDGIFDLPLDSVRSLKHRITNSNRLIPISTKLGLLLETMNDDEKAQFHTTIQNHTIPTPKLSDRVKEALVDHATFQFRKLGKVHRNYDDIMALTYRKQPLKDPSLDPLSKTQPSKLNVAYYTNRSTQNGFELSYRPILLDLHDIQYRYMQESELSVFSFKGRYSKSDASLERFDLMRLKSLPKHLSFYTQPSWMLSSYLSRENHQKKLRFNNELGFGATKELIGGLSGSLLLNLGFENTHAYLKPYLFLYAYPTEQTKITLESFYKYYTKPYRKERLTLSHKYQNIMFNLSITNGTIREDSECLVGIGIDY